jgi:hypothetical protein
MSIHKLICIALMIVSGAILSLGQNGEAADIEKLQKKVTELESQLRALSDEINKLKDTKKTTPAEVGTDTKEPAVAKAAVPESEKKKEMGIDVGSARITPYGSIYVNAFNNSGATNNADVPLFATPTGRGNAGASVRQTRLGLRLEGARIGESRLGAVIETDFFGGFPAVGIGENFGVVRLRLAYMKIDRERTSFTVGQDWMVFAPQNPTSLAAAAIPQLAAAGNNWGRIPQFKADHKLDKNVRVQGAVLAPQTGDSAAASAFFLQPNSGSVSRVPFFQGRIAFSDSNFFATGKPGTIGVSAHYGRSRVYIGTPLTRYDIDSTGLAADWNIPLSRRVVLVGEAFTGKNLAGFQGGIFQGYNAEFATLQGSTLVATGVRGIRSRGGWAQLGFTPTVAKDRLSFYGSAGIDDPDDRDLVTLVPRDLRRRNLAWAFDAIYKVTPQFSVGFEYRGFNTHWTLSGRRTSNHANLGAVYTF